MNSIEWLLNDLHSRGVVLQVNGARLAIKAPPGVLTEEDRFSIREVKDELMALLSGKDLDALDDGPPISIPALLTHAHPDGVDADDLAAFEWSELAQHDPSLKTAQAHLRALAWELIRARTAEGPWRLAELLEGHPIRGEIERLLLALDDGAADGAQMMAAMFGRPA